MTDPHLLYRRWLFEVWTDDPAAAYEILTPYAVGHWPDHDVRGPKAFVGQVARSTELFDDIKMSLEVGPLVDGNRVAARWTFHGTYRGGLPDATAAPGTRVSFVGHDLFRIEGARFADYWVVSDAMGLMTRLGAVG